MEPASKADLEQVRTQLKGDIAQVRTELKGDIAQIRTELKGDIEQAKDELTELMRGIETRLLQAFYGFAETNNKRLAQFDSNIVNFLSRVTTLEDRMLVVEKRLQIPPPLG